MDLRRLGSKLLQLLAVLLVVSFFCFLLVDLLPSDPVTAGCSFCTEEDKAEFREEIGLDDPLLTRYVSWLGGFLTGDWGRYFDNKAPVREVVGDALPVSLQLMVYAQVMALVIAIPAGVYAASKAGTRRDKAMNATAFGMLALPNFVLAIYLTYFLSVQLNWFPSQSYVPFGEDPVEHLRGMFLPALSLAVGQIAVYMRLLRSDMIQTLQEDFITVAKAKGMSQRRILFRHALRPSSLTLLTVAGLNVGTLIGGAVVIEVLFGLQGIGTRIFEAVSNGENIALQSLVTLVAFGYLFVNLVIDITYSLVDPRIRHG